jgi:nondiscriminating aspartyl-tRNA synthetase
MTSLKLRITLCIYHNQQIIGLFLTEQPGLFFSFGFLKIVYNKLINTMERTLIKETTKLIGQKVKVAGFVQAIRSHGKIAFLDLADRSGTLQVFISKPDLIKEVSDQTAIEIEGTVQARPEKMINKEISTGTVELSAESVKILAKAEVLPFDLREMNVTLPTLLDFRALTLRNEKIKNIFLVQESLMEGFRQISQELGCTEIFVPTISASATEGGAEVFKVNYYGYSAYMTQSPQLYKQMMVPVFERVYLVSHAYRAEPSVTTRHLSESIQLDCEFGFVEFEELLDLLEIVAVAMLKNVEEKRSEILKNYGVEKIAFGKIPRLTMREAQEIIYKETGRDVRNEKDLGPEDEVDICQWAKKEKGSDLVTITHYPTKKRAFYTMPDPENPEYSLSYDLLFRGMEMASGSQRINDYQELLKAIKDRNLEPKDFEMYLQAFKFGMPKEGGFSFGLERLTKNVLNLANVREASLFPRDMERVDQRLSILQPEKNKKTKDK